MILWSPICQAKMLIGPIPNTSLGGPAIWIPRAGPTPPPTPTSSLHIPTNTGSGPRVQTTPFSVFGDELQSVLVIVGSESDLQLFPADSFGAYAYHLPTFPPPPRLSVLSFIPAICVIVFCIYPCLRSMSKTTCHRVQKHIEMTRNGAPRSSISFSTKPTECGPSYLDKCFKELRELLSAFRQLLRPRPNSSPILNGSGLP